MSIFLAIWYLKLQGHLLKSKVWNPKFRIISCYLLFQDIEEVIIQIISHAITKVNIQAAVLIDSTIIQAVAELCRVQVKLG